MTRSQKTKRDRTPKWLKEHRRNYYRTVCASRVPRMVVSAMRMGRYMAENGHGHRLDKFQLEDADGNFAATCLHCGDRLLLNLQGTPPDNTLDGILFQDNYKTARVEYESYWQLRNCWVCPGPTDPLLATASASLPLCTKTKQ